jgi:hypothetical protein
MAYMIPKPIRTAEASTPAHSRGRHDAQVVARIPAMRSCADLGEGRRIQHAAIGAL